MINIEALAKEMFERFARDSGTIAKWEYLNKNRQKIWIRDITLVANRLLLELKKDIKPPAVVKTKTETSYALGFADGKREERVYFITLLQDCHAELVQDYEDFLAEE